MSRLDSSARIQPSSLLREPALKGLPEPAMSLIGLLTRWHRLLVACSLAGCLSGLSAAPAGSTAPPADTLAQRVLACTGCHGKEGRATPAGYFPRIAGKPAGYLYQQLLNFRDERRQYAPMAALIENLSDDYLREIAGHFANLELPYPSPAPSTAGAASLARGEQLAQRGDPAKRIPACVACHGVAMTGVNPAVPGLLGLPRDYLNAQLGAWRTGQRQARTPDCMAQIAQRMDVADISAVAAWLAAQALPASTRPADRHLTSLPLPCGSIETGAGQ